MSTVTSAATRRPYDSPDSIGLAKLTHIQRADSTLDTGREAGNAFIFLPQNILANLSFPFRNLHAACAHYWNTKVPKLWKS